MGGRAEHDWGFAYYTVVGFLIGFGFITGFSIGMPILLLGVALLIGRWLSGWSWPADLGLLAGGGIVCLVIAGLHALGPQGGWIAAGATSISVSTVAYWWLHCRPGVRDAPTH